MSCGDHECPGPGKDGEALISGAGDTTRIRFPSRWGSRYHIPDVLDDDSRILGEVKNVRYQHYSTQLRNYVDWAKAQVPPYKVYVFVRGTGKGGTTVAKTLLNAEREGKLTIVRALPTK